jgi:hypothetical protein
MTKEDEKELALENAKIELALENAKLEWREEARVRARQDVKDEGLTGEEAEGRFQELFAEHYAELESNWKATNEVWREGFDKIYGRIFEDFQNWKASQGKNL